MEWENLLKFKKKITRLLAVEAIELMDFGKNNFKSSHYKQESLM